MLSCSKYGSFLFIISLNALFSYFILFHWLYNLQLDSIYFLFKRRTKQDFNLSNKKSTASLSITQPNHEKIVKTNLFTDCFRAMHHNFFIYHFIQCIQMLSYTFSSWNDSSPHLRIIHIFCHMDFLPNWLSVEWKRVI